MVTQNVIAHTPAIRTGSGVVWDFAPHYLLEHPAHTPHCTHTFGALFVLLSTKKLTDTRLRLIPLKQRLRHSGMVRTKVKWFAGDQAGMDEAKAAAPDANVTPANSTMPKTGGGKAASGAQQSAQLAGHCNKFTETLSMLKKNATAAGLSNKELEALEATFEQSMTTTKQQLTASRLLLDQCKKDRTHPDGKLKQMEQTIQKLTTPDDSLAQMQAQEETLRWETDKIEAERQAAEADTQSLTVQIELDKQSELDRAEQEFAAMALQLNEIEAQQVLAQHSNAELEEELKEVERLQEVEHRNLAVQHEQEMERLRNELEETVIRMVEREAEQQQLDDDAWAEVQYWENK